MKREFRTALRGGILGGLVGLFVGWLFVQTCGCTNDTIDVSPDPCNQRMSVCLGYYDLATCDLGAVVAIDDCNAWCVAEEGPGYRGSCAPDPFWPEAYAYCACRERAP